MSDEHKKYTLKELKDKLTNKEKKFCHQYIIDWNGTRAAKSAGYSEKTSCEIASENLRKPHIQQYIEFIKDDFETEAGLSKLKMLNELSKIAFSSIAHLHNTWIELKDFESLSDVQKEAIESIETKTEIIHKYSKEDLEKVPVEIKYVKLKLYSKTQAIDQINKMMGYNAPEKVDHTTKGESINDLSKLSTDELIQRAEAIKSISNDKT